jgi:hypothetical protein
MDDDQDELDLRAAEARQNDQAERRLLLEDRVLVLEQLLRHLQLTGLTR